MQKTGKKYSDGSYEYILKCIECGEKSVLGPRRKKGYCKKCLHELRSNLAKKRKGATIHGLRYHPKYETWKNMKRRCYQKNNPKYKNYGARGITVCDEWKNDAKSFIDYISNLEHYMEEGRTLDRIDNNKGYEPGNVKWSTSIEQMNNRQDVKTNTGEKFISKETVKNYTRFRINKTGESFKTLENALLKRREHYGF